MTLDFDVIFEKLNYQFNDKKLLQAALTHCSVASDNNERLEFLGDSIVNFLIAKILFQKFPQAREGDLSRIRASLVKGETLAEIARELQLGKHLHLGAGELKSGGQQRASILADTVEAIIAAIYLDSDMNTCQERVAAWFAERLNKLNLTASSKDPKTQLQECLQAKKLPLPSYDVIAIEGQAHAQKFQVKCSVAGLAHTTKGRGSSRRRAEQIAASEFLQYLKEERS